MSLEQENIPVAVVNDSVVTLMNKIEEAVVNTSAADVIITETEAPANKKRRLNEGVYEIAVAEDQGLYASTSLPRLFQYVNHRYKIYLTESFVYRDLKKTVDGKLSFCNVKGGRVTKFPQMYNEQNEKIFMYYDEWRKTIVARGLHIHEDRILFI